jgi:hypothetical protein
MTDTDKLLLYVMEICRRDQVESLLEISQTKGRPIAVMVVEAVRIMLDSLTPEERQPVIAQFKEEDGIDLEEFL